MFYGDEGFIGGPHTLIEMPSLLYPRLSKVFLAGGTAWKNPKTPNSSPTAYPLSP